jgi:hypothetical protein
LFSWNSFRRLKIEIETGGVVDVACNVVYVFVLLEECMQSSTLNKVRSRALSYRDI